MLSLCVPRSGKSDAIAAGQVSVCRMFCLFFSPENEDCDETDGPVDDVVYGVTKAVVEQG